MANNIYILDQLVTGPETITLQDDGSGSDWLTVQGVYATPTDLRLFWADETEAMGIYYLPDTVGHRLILQGGIENIRGSDGRDYIQGNSGANILYGDQAQTGAGGADSIYGYDGADRMYGGAGNDSMGGGGGNDLMLGDGGDDALSGGIGNDTLIGGAGADVLEGGSDARDMVSYQGSTAAVRVDITYGSATYGQGGHAAGDRIFGFADVTGSGFADLIRDTRKETIAFGYNDNRFYGGAGNDRLYLGGGDDRGDGGSGRDSLYGEIGNDTLLGGAGQDLIRGGSGADRLYGGSEADLFVFASAADSTATSAGRDKIMDFSRTQGDRIDLHLIDARPNTTADDAFQFIGTDAFTGTRGQLRWQVAGADAILRADLNGDGAADFSLLFVGVHSLRAGDFLL